MEHFDGETKQLLENLVAAAAHPSLSQRKGVKWLATESRMDLALLLREMAIEPDQQKMHTEWAIKYLRKHLNLKPQFIEYRKQRTHLRHPVFEGLEPEWFEERPLTVREESRKNQVCGSCRRGPPFQTLFRCTGCSFEYYCSRKCQKKNWSQHKHSCKSAMAMMNRRGLGGDLPKPETLAMRSLFMEWFKVPHYANREALIFALGLHRDPSRGRTHFAFRRIERVPHDHEGMDLRSRFRVVQCSVYRIQGISRDLEKMLKMEDAEQTLRDAVNSVCGPSGLHVPALHITAEVEGENCSHGHLFMRPVTFNLEYVLDLADRYDPNWRKVVNDGITSAGPLPVPSGAADAEFAF